MLNTKVGIIDNSFKYDSSASKVDVKNYATLESLNKSLEYYKDIKFDIVIDLTKLYQFEIINNEFKSNEYKLPLNELFPNSCIFSINESLKVEENCNNIKKLLKK